MKAGDIVSFSWPVYLNGKDIELRIYGIVTGVTPTGRVLVKFKRHAWPTLATVPFNDCTLVTDKYIIHETLLRLSGNEGW